MKKNVMFSISAILLLIILVYSVICFDSDFAVPMSVFVGSGTETEEIFCWKSEDGNAYFFLPSYANLAEVRIHIKTEDKICIGAEEMVDGRTLAGYETGVPYQLVYTSDKQTCETTVIFAQSTKLPTIYIDTQSGSMDYIHKEKGNEEACVIRLYNPNGTLGYSGKIDNMNGRGNASWEKSDKKPYSLTLEEEADLLNMGSAKRWILLANALDPSHVRNKLTLELARTMGMQYTADCEWIDLYLNGVYAGLYLLSERNEVHPQRVNISKDGFLVSMEKKARLDSQHHPYVQTQQGLTFRLHDLENVGSDYKARIADAFQAAENAILSEEGIDPITGKSWDSLIDTESWARMFLLNEITGDLDSFKASQYFYSDIEDGKIYAGPIWDSDMALGNDENLNWSLINPDTFVVCRYLNDDFVGPRWIRSLLRKEQFYEKVVTLFQNEFYPVIEANLDEMLGQYEQTIAAAFEMNRLRWQDERNSDSIQTEAAQVRSYIHEHMQFLYSAWVEGVPYCQVTFRGSSSDQFVAVVYGSTLSQMPMVEDTQTQVFAGWFYEGTDKPFDSRDPITEDISLYAQWEDKPGAKQFFDACKKYLQLVPSGVIVILGIILLMGSVGRNRKNKW